MESEELLYYLNKLKELNLSNPTDGQSNDDEVFMNVSFVRNLLNDNPELMYSLFGEVKNEDQPPVSKSAEDVHEPKVDKDDLDNVPIATRYKDFDKLLENELKKDGMEKVSKRKSKTPSRPYLRKGEGMQRFGLTKKDIGLTKSKMPWMRKCNKSKSASNEKSITDVDKVDHNFKRKLDYETTDRETWAGILSNCKNFKNFPEYTSDESMLLSPSVAKVKMQKEAAEQKIFEMLEEKVDNPNFNPDFFNRPSYNSTGIDPRLLTLTDRSNDDTLKPVNNDEGIDNTETDDNLSESSDTEETCKMVNEFIPTSTPNQEHFAINKEINLKADKKIKIVINNDDSQSTPQVIIKKQNSDFSDMSETLDFRNHDDSSKQSKGELLTKKLAELENEIEIFQSENASLQKFAEELAREKSEFIKEKALMESKLKEEKVLSEYYLVEEKEKLQKQKSLYDRYVRDLKGQIAKKEKEETFLLQKDVDSLKEQLAMKDAKFGATQARLRNQIKSLENENKTLREECEKLKKENRKLVRTNDRTRRLNNIKLLADINKTVSQINIDKNETAKQAKDTTKPIVIKHNMRRTKSTPNLAVTSRYAKHFSERNKDSKEKPSEQGYGLQSDTEDDHSMDSEPENTQSDHNLELDRRHTTLEISEKKSEKTPHNHKMNLNSYSIKNDESKNSTENKHPRNFRPDSRIDDKVDDSISRTEKMREDGNIEIKYSNGNRKIVSPDGSYSKFIFYNGDVKEMFYDDGIIKYYYKEPKVYHTSYKDGSEVLQFPDGYIENRYPDGSVQAHHPNGTIKWIKPGKNEEWQFPDGTSLSINSEKEQVIRFPNGQVEIHTAEFKKREYPDGTVKIAYSDGLIETRYASGRIRIKDKHGNLIMDTLNHRQNLKH